MRVVLAVLLPCLILIVLLPVGVMDSHPQMEATPQPKPDNLAHVRSLFHNTVLTHDGTLGAPVRQVILTADDIESAINFALSRKKWEGSATCKIQGDRLLLHTSIHLRNQLDQGWLNLRVSAIDMPGSARIQNLRIGHINLPYPIGGWLVRSLLHVPPLSRFEGIGNEVIRDIHIINERLVLTMNGNRHLLAQGGVAMTDLADTELLQVYHHRLADLLNESHSSRFIRLGKLMQPLFALAKTRSTPQAGGDPVAENRAILVTLNAYVNGNDLSESLPTEARLPKRGLLLNKRVDTAKHFLGAAVLAMSGQGTLVEVAGLAKELHDTHEGSGFSFIDLAADEAGALFGKITVRSRDRARRVQDLLSVNPDEGQFIPALKDLPESMNPETFAARFRSVQSPEFAALKQQIAARIHALPIYHEM